MVGSLPDEAQVGVSEVQSNFKDVKFKKHNTETVFLGTVKILPTKSNCRIQLQSVISVCERPRQEDYGIEGRLQSKMRLSQKDKTKRFKVFIYKLFMSFDTRKLFQETISVLISLRSELLRLLEYLNNEKNDSWRKFQAMQWWQLKSDRVRMDDHRMP